jgi:hypothetical protein
MIQSAVHGNAVAPGPVVPGAAAHCAVALALALQLACTSVRAPPASPRLPPAAAAEDASYDWHGLVTVPFGTAFAALYEGLHEVLQFRDATQGGATNTAQDALEGDECYRSNAPGPRFVGQVTTDYLWCFLHDHLERIAAVVRLPSADVPAVFERYCTRWLEHADDAERAATHCTGRDGALVFSARLQGTGPDSTTDLAIVVYEAPKH